MALITLHWHCLISQLHPATYFVGKSKRWVKLEGFCPKTGSGRGLVFLLKKWERVFFVEKVWEGGSAWQSNRPPGARSLVRGLSPRCAHSQTIILKMCTSLALPISKTNNGLWLMTPTVQCPYEDRMLKDQTFATCLKSREFKDQIWHSFRSTFCSCKPNSCLGRRLSRRRHLHLWGMKRRTGPTPTNVGAGEGALLGGSY